MVYATFPRISPDDQQQTLKHVRYGAHFEAETNIVRCRLRVQTRTFKDVHVLFAFPPIATDLRITGTDETGH
jgi:hypothetical protein